MAQFAFVGAPRGGDGSPLRKLKEDFGFRRGAMGSGSGKNVARGGMFFSGCSCQFLRGFSGSELRLADTPSMRKELDESP